ncbi:MAG TPA: arginase family protein [Gemmatimonadaceae bacterium]
MKAHLIAVPFDSGIRDVRMGRGPLHLLEIGIVEALERSGASVSVHVVEPSAEAFGAEVALSFEIQRLVAKRVAEARGEGAFPIVLSGNCNTAVGTVAGLTKTTGEAPGVCWFDAHGDFNTPDTTTSGFLDGMAVAMVAGRCWQGMTAKVSGFRPVPESRIVMVGARALDDPEERALGSSNVRRAKIDDAHSIFADVRAKSVYMHVDMDVFDPSVGKANGFAVGGGLTREEFMSFAARAKKELPLGALAVTAYDPSCDEGDTMGRLAVDIARGFATGDGLS